MSQPTNIFAAVHNGALGEMHFAPDETSELFKPDDHEPGSPERVAVLAFRNEHGLPLWHSGDRNYTRHADLLPSEQSPRISTLYATHGSTSQHRYGLSPEAEK